MYLFKKLIIKKMKQLRILLTVFAMLFTMQSCEDKLELEPQGAPSSDNFWKTTADAVSGVDAIYGHYSNDNMYGRGFFWLYDASDDIAHKPRANATKIREFKVDGSESETKFIWGLHYQVMKRCNDVLRNVPAIAMNQALKNRMLGEAYFNHAVMHLELAYHYGDDRAGIPIQDRENVLNTSYPRAKNVGVNYDYITKDLIKAAELLPYFSELGTDNYGRAHKTAAWAYLVRTYLYAKDWDNAKKYADLVINSGKHQLLSNYEDVFKIKNNWSSEYIWSVTSLASNQGLGCILPGVFLEDKGWGFYNGWGVFYPTVDLYNTYQVGDKRRNATILAIGDKFKFLGEERTYGLLEPFIPSSSNPSGMMFRKYLEPYTYPKKGNDVDINYINTNPDKPTTTLNVPLLRYADVIMMKAEAKLMKGENADTEINMIRVRAGLTPISGATLTDLKRERRCEFAGEWTADRHYDLVRWGDAEATYAKDMFGYAVLKRVNPNDKTEILQYELKKIYSGRIFKPTIHHIWPIPPEEIAASKGELSQNVGW
jgi:starch-binding outer membrane protein, SusD/RagB family